VSTRLLRVVALPMLAAAQLALLAGPAARGGDAATAGSAGGAAGDSANRKGGDEYSGANRDRPDRGDPGPLDDGPATAEPIDRSGPFPAMAAAMLLLTLVCAGLYMVLANYGLVFFTGKNVYLLGLDSVSDTLEAILLLAGAAALLAAAPRTDPHLPGFETEPGVRPLGAARDALITPIDRPRALPAAHDR
jgi:hypothetical protein